jgi:hypothetical protein
MAWQTSDPLDFRSGDALVFYRLAPLLNVRFHLQSLRLSVVLLSWTTDAALGLLPWLSTHLLCLRDWAGLLGALIFDEERLALTVDCWGDMLLCVLNSCVLLSLPFFNESALLLLLPHEFENPLLLFCLPPSLLCRATLLLTPLSLLLLLNSLKPSHLRFSLLSCLLLPPPLLSFPTLPILLLLCEIPRLCLFLTPLHLLRLLLCCLLPIVLLTLPTSGLKQVLLVQNGMAELIHSHGLSKEGANPGLNKG